MGVGLDDRTATQRAVLDHAVRSDLHVVFDDHRAFENHIHIDQHITAHTDLPAHIEARRIAQRHAPGHQTTSGTLLVMAFQLGQLDTVVGTLHFHSVQRLLGGHAQPVGHSHGDDVSQVVLALGIAVGQATQPLAATAARSGENPGIALADRLPLFSCILVLDDSPHLPAPGAYDAHIAGWDVE